MRKRKRTKEKEQNKNKNKNKNTIVLSYIIPLLSPSLPSFLHSLLTSLSFPLKTFLFVLNY
jgi:hypothetical protein